MYTFVKVGGTGWVEVVLVRLRWTTASWHGVVVHHRTSAPDRQSWPATAETTTSRYGGCPDHSSEAHEQATKPCIVFYVSLRAFRTYCRTPTVAWFDGQLGASWWPL
jgi:hypothetical protein